VDVWRAKGGRFEPIARYRNPVPGAVA
jgi:hypothetical protein